MEKNMTHNINYNMDTTIPESECERIRANNRAKEDFSYIEIAEQNTYPVEAITYHLRGECDCQHAEDPVMSKKPWAEKEVLKNLIIQKNLDFKEAGIAFGCHKETVKNWAGEDGFDIMLISSDERVSSKFVRGPHREGVRRFSDLDRETLIRNARKYAKQRQEKTGTN